MKCDLSITFFN